MRSAIRTLALVLAMVLAMAFGLGFAVLASAGGAHAGDGKSAQVTTGTSREAPTDLSAQRRRDRARTRIRVYRYPGSYPGPNAVRECRAWYAEELRLSGPVIVPHMRCWWRRG
jgi:hypothetical protein